MPSRPLAYRLTCVNGRQNLLGTADPPFPLTAQEVAMPSNAAETSAVMLVVSLNAFTQSEIFSNRLLLICKSEVALNYFMYFCKR